MENLRKTALVAAVVSTLGIGLNARANGIVASPQARQMLNERAALAAAPVASSNGRQRVQLRMAARDNCQGR